MGINIQHNMQALNAHRNMGVANTQNAKAQEKLSSGYRINRAGDDAAGLAISEKMRAQVKGLNQASRNAQDGISLIQTAEGALATTHDILRRMRTLAVQSASDTNTSSDRTNIELEVTQLKAEVDRISDTTEFNTMKLLDGTFTGKELQIGANSGQKISLAISNMDFATIAGTVTLATKAGAVAALASLDSAINTVSEMRATLGAKQNRMEYTVTNLDTTAENLQAAESRVRDVDMASEVLNQTQTNVLQQAAQSMLALANQQPQSVLQLLG